MGQPRVLNKAPPTFQGPLWVGQPKEGCSLGEVPLEPLIRAGSFTDLWGRVGGQPRGGCEEAQAYTSLGLPREEKCFGITRLRGDRAKALSPGQAQGQKPQQQF